MNSEAASRSLKCRIIYCGLVFMSDELRERSVVKPPQYCRDPASLNSSFSITFVAGVGKSPGRTDGAVTTKKTGVTEKPDE